MSPSKSISKDQRLILGVLIFLAALLLLAGGWFIPFHFESFSILYKFGKLKVYLRSGKVIGITIVLLLFYQIVIASHFKILEKVLPFKSLFKLHRINGFIIACLAAAHPLLIKASENFTPYTFGRKYYPEFVGIGLLFFLLSLSFAAVFKNFLKIPYKKWLLLHRLGVTMVLVLLPGHILFVSDTFKSGLPRVAAMTIFFLNYLLILRIWIRKLLTFYG
jgi:predicted ferric reductase